MYYNARDQEDTLYPTITFTGLLMSTETKSSIQVIDRATRLLDALSRYAKPTPLKILSADTELHPSTAFRILQSLIANRFVEKNADGNYKLGQRILQMSNRLHSDLDIKAIAMPFMERLKDQLGETINLTIREGDVVIYFEKVTPNRMMHVQQVIGSRAPLHVTAVGKLMLGLGGEQEIHAYSQRTNLPAYTQNTLSSFQALKTECMQSHQQGYSFDNEEAEIGVGCIGVLIYDSKGQVAAGLSVSAPISRRKSDWVDELISAGQNISNLLGYSKDGTAD